jgi:glutathione S-transferase
MSNDDLHLISFDICPYVQRAMIVLLEKNAEFKISYIDLQNKPDWFLKISPLGKVPLLQVGNTTLFESNVICEYIDETRGEVLHPSDPLIKAQHRAWMEYSGVLLGLLYGIAVAADDVELSAKKAELSQRLGVLETELKKGNGPFFAGSKFQMVDAFYGPVFRYFQAYAQWGDLSYLAEFPRLQAWEANVMKRTSVQKAVPEDYSEKLKNFLKLKDGVYVKKLNFK